MSGFLLLRFYFFVFVLLARFIVVHILTHPPCLSGALTVPFLRTISYMFHQIPLDTVSHVGVMFWFFFPFLLILLCGHPRSYQLQRSKEHQRTHE